MRYMFQVKVALLTDTHWGARGDSTQFLNYFKLFYDKVFFPELQKRKIDYIFHLGDLVDRRKYVNFNTLSFIRENFLDKLHGKFMHIIPGNHDSFHKNTIEVNALNELLGGYTNINVISEPTNLEFFKHKIVMLPWICKSNEESTFKLIGETKTKVLFGHLELNGFEMHRGSVCDHGLDKKIFSKFDLICSGHFHHKSSKDNIHYLGAPYEMTWSDWNDTKGFHILDLNTLELEFIRNPFVIHERIDLRNDETLTGNYNSKFIRVLVNKDVKNLEKIISTIEEQNPHNLTIIEDKIEYTFDDKSEVVLEDPKKTIENYIDSIDIGTDELKKFIINLYDEALLLRI